MPKKSEENTYLVGYRKPPTEHQFKKGTSGNSKGRPRKNSKKKETNIELLSRIFDEEIITGNGAKISFREAALRKLLTSIANKGNVKAMLTLMELLPASQENPADHRAEVRRKLNDLALRLKDAQERGIDPSLCRSQETQDNNHKV